MQTWNSKVLAMVNFVMSVNSLSLTYFALYHKVLVMEKLFIWQLGLDSTVHLYPHVTTTVKLSLTTVPDIDLPFLSRKHKSHVKRKI